MRQVLAPALPLSHLLRHSRRIAERLRIRRPKRPLQASSLQRLQSG
jgi:hypothetical protein